MSRAALRVGTYARAGGRGLYWLDYDQEAGFTLGPPFKDAVNASFGAWSARHGVHYLVDEQAMGRLGAYRAGADGWRSIGQVSSEGREPCYVALDASEDRIAVANYGSGSIALFELGPDGVPRDAGALWANSGGGPNADRQEGPHVHCVQFSPDGRWLYAVDLGTDQVLRFSLESPVPLERARLAYQAPAGSGPRHLLFVPSQPVALLVSELASTLSLLDATGEGLALRAQCSTVPAGFVGESLGGDLAVNAAGDCVYVSNRGHDSIAVFRLHAANRTLELLQHIEVGSASPRFLLLLEDLHRLIVANEEGGRVCAFEILADGQLAPTEHQVAVPGPAFVLREAEAVVRPTSWRASPTPHRAEAAPLITST